MYVDPMTNYLTLTSPTLAYLWCCGKHFYHNHPRLGNLSQHGYIKPCFSHGWPQLTSSKFQHDVIGAN
jgi:hypothetical protein